MPSDIDLLMVNEFSAGPWLYYMTHRLVMADICVKRFDNWFKDV